MPALQEGGHGAAHSSPEGHVKALCCDSRQTEEEEESKPYEFRKLLNFHILPNLLFFWFLENCSVQSSIHVHLGTDKASSITKSSHTITPSCSPQRAQISKKKPFCHQQQLPEFHTTPKPHPE